MERILGHQTLKMATYTWPGFLPSQNLTSLLYNEVSILAAEKNQVKLVLLSYIGGGVSLGTSELIKYIINGMAARTGIAVLLGSWLLKSFL